MVTKYPKRNFAEGLAGLQTMKSFTQKNPRAQKTGWNFL